MKQHIKGSLFVAIMFLITASCLEENLNRFDVIEGIVIKVDFGNPSGFLGGRGYTIVTFSDGRIKHFNATTSKTILLGKHNIFYYDKFGDIREVKIEEKKGG